MSNCHSALGAQNLQNTFEQYAKQLDDFNTRHESVRNLSREITKESKHSIFLMHRAKPSDMKTILDHAQNCLEKIRAKFGRVGEMMHTESERYRFQKAVSPGYQEYVEAESFHYFLSTNGGLISKKLIWERLCRSCPDICLPPFSTSDYLLGIADLSGEVMRKTVDWALNGDMQAVTNSCIFLQKLLCGIVSLSAEVIKEWPNKVTCFRESTIKVETTLLKLHLKRADFPNLDVTISSEDLCDDRCNKREAI
uniref:Translin-associated factor X n=1 Tax=Spongospora subterranea TaxID=70186 RepID=A0A0H5RCI0_9EUKA|eukprot:CRZ11282.1 hypothetical protein [Spongospora subterranea]